MDCGVRVKMWEESLNVNTSWRWRRWHSCHVMREMNGSFMSSRAGQLANVTRDHLTQFTSDPRAATCAPAGLVSASARLCSANSTWQREVSCCRRQVAHPHLDIIRRLPHPRVETVINLSPNLRHGYKCTGPSCRLEWASCFTDRDIEAELWSVDRAIRDSYVWGKLLMIKITNKQ